MTVIMPKTWAPMTIDEESIVAVLLGEVDGLRREEIADRVLTPGNAPATLDAALAALIAGGAVTPPATTGR